MKNGKNWYYLGIINWNELTWYTRCTRLTFEKKNMRKWRISWSIFSQFHSFLRFKNSLKNINSYIFLLLLFKSVFSINRRCVNIIETLLLCGIVLVTAVYLISITLMEIRGAFSPSFATLGIPWFFLVLIFRAHKLI